MIQQNQFYSIGPTSLILNLNMFVLVSWYEILLFRLPDHGQQDLELLRLKGQDLLHVLADCGRSDLLRQFLKVWRKLEALDVTSEVKKRLTLSANLYVLATYHCKSIR